MRTGLDAVLKAEELPACIASLDACLHAFSSEKGEVSGYTLRGFDQAVPRVTARTPTWPRWMMIISLQR